MKIAITDLLWLTFIITVICSRMMHNVFIEVLIKLLTAAKNIAVTPVTLLLIQNIFSWQEDLNYPSYPHAVVHNLSFFYAPKFTNLSNQTFEVLLKTIK